jgi:ATP-dependent DNA helicase HFM1/MER3
MSEGYGVLAKFDIILTTPEKFDAISRRWKDLSGLMDNIGLLCVDETHTIGDSRGGVLEGIVARCKTMSNVVKSKCLSAPPPIAALRVVAVSATINNIDDFAMWLNAQVYVFGDEHRPCPLTTHVLGYPSSHNEFLFQRNLDFRLIDVIRTHAQGKPSLVFCSTRNLAMGTATFLVQNSGSMFIRDFAHRANLELEAMKTHDKVLSSAIKHGLGIHTAGLDAHDRAQVETLFRQNQVCFISRWPSETSKTTEPTGFRFIRVVL